MNSAAYVEERSRRVRFRTLCIRPANDFDISLITDEELGNALELTLSVGKMCRRVEIELAAPEVDTVDAIITVGSTEQIELQPAIIQFQALTQAQDLALAADEVEMRFWSIEESLMHPRMIFTTAAETEEADRLFAEACAEPGGAKSIRSAFNYSSGAAFHVEFKFWVDYDTDDEFDAVRYAMHIQMK